MRVATAAAPEQTRRTAVLGTSRRLRHRLTVLAFLSPWLIGFSVFILYPLFASLYYSFTNTNLLTPPRWVGLSNYKLMFTLDTTFRHALYNTFYFVIISVPLSIAIALALALLLNLPTRLRSVYRTVVFLPTMVPAVASTILWLWLLDPQSGLINAILGVFGVHGPGWLSSPTWAKPAIILMSLWGVGTWSIILLAGLQSIPRQQYEAAQLDGASAFQQFSRITVPALSPILFFNLVIGLIGAFQTFTQVYILGGTSGSPAGSLMFYALYIYNMAFGMFHMGYASAMAWLLFILILAVTALVFRALGRRVYYEAE